LFANVYRAASSLAPPDQPLCIAIDDTLVRRTGTHMHGVAWRRDPLGPKFQVNFVRAQRFLQFSLAVPSHDQPNLARMIPVDFWHCPTPVKPGDKASTEDLQKYREDARKMNLSTQTLARLQHLRDNACADSAPQTRKIHLLVDGQYTNGSILKKLPSGVILIGRIRKDAKLCFAPGPHTGAARGRRLLYGEIAPTPEQVRANDEPWQTVEIFAAGTTHQCRVKAVTGLMWRTAGSHLLLKLVVIGPLAYRIRIGSKLLYRQPAFLICTDPTIDTRQMVQQYVWRWGVEINFREEKSLLGVGDGQVRNPEATQTLPAFRVATYALLLLAALRGSHDKDDHPLLPPPKWRAHSKPQLPSTQHLIHSLRAEVWGRGLGLETNFSDFLEQTHSASKPEKFQPSLASALLYCND
jgi:hypothetical protein